MIAARHRYGLIGSAAAVGIVVVIALVWNWNWFRPMVERRISAQLDRPVQLGHFDIKGLLSFHPLVVLDAVSIGNPPDFPNGTQFGSIDRLSARVDLWALLWSRGGDVVLPEIAIEHPNGDLRPGPKGNPNWVFGLPASSNPQGTPMPRIGGIVITEGNFHVADPKLQADFIVAVHTEAPKNGGEEKLVANIHGTYAKQPISATFTGGALLSLRDPNKPYPVDLRIDNGETHILMKGTIQDPLHLDGAALQLELDGKNLADLYPLIGIPLAPTPPFQLVGHVDYTDNRIRFQKFAGMVGQSDLEGDFEVERAGRERPLVTANLTSRKVVLADLAGFIGATPGKEDAANDTLELKQKRAAQRSNPKLIPDVPVDLPKLEVADFKVTYVAHSIQSDATPFDNLRANLTIENGKVSLLPLSFGIGQSSISGNIHLDPVSGDQVHAVADIDFRQLDLKKLLQKITDFNGDGFVGGEAHIKGTGNSLSQMLGNGDGTLKMFMSGGDVSAFLIDLAGLDLGKSVLSWLGLPDRAPLRCMIGDFALDQGMLKTRNLLLDTTEANLIGKGGVNMKDEAVAIELTTQPKHPSFGRLPLPIDVGGTLKDPSVGPGLRLVGQDGAAATLLSLLTIQLGTGKDNDCQTILKGATNAALSVPDATSAAANAVAPPRP